MSALKRLPGSTTFARAWLVALFALPVIGLVAGIATGYIDPQITATATVDLTTPLAWLAKGLVVVFLAFTAIQVIRLTGLQFWSRVGTAAARLMDGYEMPDSQDVTEAAEAIDEASDDDV